MFTKLMTATAFVMVSGGLAFAQASGTGTTSTTEGAGSSFQWDQTSHDSFFSNGALRSDSEVRAAYDALDAMKKDQLRAACDLDAAGAAGSATGTGTAGASTSGDASTSGATSGTSTGTATSGSIGTSAGTDSAASMPDAASMQQLCAQIKTY